MFLPNFSTKNSLVKSHEARVQARVQVQHHPWPNSQLSEANGLWSCAPGFTGEAQKLCVAESTSVASRNQVPQRLKERPWSSNQPFLRGYGLGYGYVTRSFVGVYTCIYLVWWNGWLFLLGVFSE